MPYTYYLEWTNTGMKYYGARWACDCHPDDLFVTYFTSSIYVKRYIEEHGNPDVIKIRKIFNDYKEVQDWENKVIKRLHAVKRKDYLNKNYGSKGWDPSDPEIIEKIRSSKIGKAMPEAVKEKISKTHKQISHTEEWNKKVSKALTGKKHTEERKRNIRLGREKAPVKTCPKCGFKGKGPNMTRYHFDNCGKEFKGPANFPKYEVTTCPHCGKSGKGGAMTRWHFDNCKEKP